MTNLRSRYPGLRPFDHGEQHYFFGRDAEIETVCRLLDLDNLTVLHGPSGMGKSSLINAGILPALSTLRNWEIPYHVVPIRFTNYDPDLARMRRAQEGHSDWQTDLIKDPIERFKVACLGEKSNWEPILPLPQTSLWLCAKKMLVDLAVRPLRIVFILDQFEELFSYPEKRVEAFARQLGDLYHQVIPDEVKTGLEKKQLIEAETASSKTSLPPPQAAQLIARMEEPLDTKILISMRSDKLHYLERLKAFLPEMMVNSFELRPFTVEQAKVAINQPASLAGEKFISPQFTLSDDLLDEIIDFLQDKFSRRIDPSQLQIVCQHLERRILAKENKLKN